MCVGSESRKEVYRLVCGNESKTQIKSQRMLEQGYRLQETIGPGRKCLWCLW